MVAEDGKSVDRKRLGAIVFADKKKRDVLNGLTHGPIRVEILRQIFDYRVMKGELLVVLDAPLLFESKILEWFCFPILVVTIDDIDK